MSTRPRVVVLWRSYLPSNLDRLRDLTERQAALGIEVSGLEVTSTDPGYAFLGRQLHAALPLATCFPKAELQDLDVAAVRAALWAAFDSISPAAIFAPATPFVEGMAAISWSLRRRRRVFLMDDAWEATDRRGRLVGAIKTLIHGCIDGVLAPHPAYRSYWQRLGVPGERVVGGVDVIDNLRFERPVTQPAAAPAFLFVGRDLPVKGLATLLAAYRGYRERCVRPPWTLNVVGPIAPRMADGVRYTGALFGAALCAEYWNARALVVPSDAETWALVVNEAMAAGLPVLATTTVGSARILIQEGVTGWLTPPRDEAAMAGRLQEISALPELSRARIARAAFEAVNRLCPLGAFSDGIATALALPPRGSAPFHSHAAAWLWRGRIELAA